MRCLLVAFLVAAGAASATDLIVGPARVVDGDTLAIGDERIRLIGIDAPGLGARMVCGRRCELCSSPPACAIQLQQPL